ncbi:hypothetical protein [Kitasatospora fiedleri]|uniref:hypothetical protein n=1 Tax=Kitasatospora fiedleri TaxID=2991545 RepID=UPI00249A81A1|nr:hypothetical protein [Kitasatospora fiedleri]
MYISRVAVSEPRYTPAPNSAPPRQTVQTGRRRRTVSSAAIATSGSATAHPGSPGRAS